jgi:hypothetical protein
LSEINYKKIFIDIFLLLVFSNSSHKIRLYDIIRKSMNKNTDTILLEVRPHKYVHSTTISPFNRHLKSTKDVEINLKPRDSWDSGEDQYFKWASLNRRPMESLAG